jgi:hypothetical protein
VHGYIENVLLMSFIVVNNLRQLPLVARTGTIELAVIAGTGVETVGNDRSIWELSGGADCIRGYAAVAD